MSQPRQRQPHELLAAIWQHCMNEYNTPGLNDWHWAALEACEHLDLTVRPTLPPKPAKRPSR